MQRTAVVVFALTSSFFVGMGGILFGAAGRTDVPMFWAYFVLMIIASVISLAVLYVHSPDLVAERLHPGPGEQDHVTIRLVTTAMVASWLIAGMDVGRYHWSDGIPRSVQLVGLVFVALGLALVLWAMYVNRFFSSAVRIQEDRGQYVVTAGPYRFVRHPGYTGGLMLLLGSGFALGSGWSLVPMLMAAGVIIWRTRLEDRMLQQRLAGYADYAHRVHERLIPGLW